VAQVRSQWQVCVLIYSVEIYVNKVLLFENLNEGDEG
jgi:hypothetical protein